MKRRQRRSIAEGIPRQVCEGERGGGAGQVQSQIWPIRDWSLHGWCRVEEPSGAVWSAEQPPCHIFMKIDYAEWGLPDLTVSSIQRAMQDDQACCAGARSPVGPKCLRLSSRSHVTREKSSAPGPRSCSLLRELIHDCTSHIPVACRWERHAGKGDGLEQRAASTVCQALSIISVHPVGDRETDGGRLPPSGRGRRGRRWTACTFWLGRLRRMKHYCDTHRPTLCTSNGGAELRLSLRHAVPRSQAQRWHKDTRNRVRLRRVLEF